MLNRSISKFKNIYGLVSQDTNNLTLDRGRVNFNCGRSCDDLSKIRVEIEINVIQIKIEIEIKIEIKINVKQIDFRI
jgi:hypothetical protein